MVAANFTTISVKTPLLLPLVHVVVQLMNQSEGSCLVWIRNPVDPVVP